MRSYMHASLPKDNVEAEIYAIIVDAGDLTDALMHPKHPRQLHGVFKEPFSFNITKDPVRIVVPYVSSLWLPFRFSRPVKSPR